MRALIAALLLVCASLVSAQTITVADSQIRQPMPGRTVTAGYFTLHNHSGQEIRLVAVSSTAFARAELHQHSHRDGMMRMEQVEYIAVSAGETVSLQPGGLHLMLFEPVAAIEAGQTLPLTLQFADGQQLMISVPVVAMPKR